MLDNQTEDLGLPVLTETPSPLEMSKIVLDWAISHPANHYQGSWGELPIPESCGTTLCAAGTACVADPNTQVQWKRGSMGGHVVVFKDGVGETWTIEDRGAQLLGLDGLTAASLFFDTDNLEVKIMLSEHIDRLEAAQHGTITCPKCKLTSHNLNDIKYRWCGNCHAHHDVLIADMDPGEQ